MIEKSRWLYKGVRFSGTVLRGWQIWCLVYKLRVWPSLEYKTRGRGRQLIDEVD